MTYNVVLIIIGVSHTHITQTLMTNAQVSDYRVPFWTVGAIILLLIPFAFLVVKPTGMNVYCQCCIQ